MAQVTDALGRPGVGIHAHRTFGLATVDVLATLAVAAAFAAASRTPFWRAFAVTFAALVVLGVVAHVAFRVPTALNKALGLA
jgi:uncharacterized membrane-anchored protein